MCLLECMWYHPICCIYDAVHAHETLVVFFKIRRCKILGNNEFLWFSDKLLPRFRVMQEQLVLIFLMHRFPMFLSWGLLQISFIVSLYILTCILFVLDEWRIFFFIICLDNFIFMQNFRTVHQSIDSIDGINRRFLKTKWWKWIKVFSVSFF